MYPQQQPNEPEGGRSYRPPPPGPDGYPQPNYLAAPGYPGPSGYPGAPGYPYPGTGYPPRGYRPGVSVPAVVSLICGILGIFVPLLVVALVLGFVALSQIRRNGGQGRGLAIAGIVLACLWVAVLVVLAMSGGLHFHASFHTFPAGGSHHS